MDTVNIIFPALRYEFSVTYPVPAHFIVIHMGLWTPQAQRGICLHQKSGSRLIIFGVGVPFVYAPAASTGSPSIILDSPLAPHRKFSHDPRCHSQCGDELNRHTEAKQVGKGARQKGPRDKP